MKTLIKFHALREPDNTTDFFKAAVMLTEQLYKKHRDQHLIVLCNPEDLEKLDDFLWTLIPESFLPHQAENAIFPTVTTIIDVTSEVQKIPLEQNIPNILINLSKNMPQDLHSFAETHLIVGKSPEYRDFCRTLFREYKKNGIPLISEAIVL